MLRRASGLSLPGEDASYLLADLLKRAVDGVHYTEEDCAEDVAVLSGQRVRTVGVWKGMSMEVRALRCAHVLRACTMHQGGGGGVEYGAWVNRDGSG